MTRDPLAFELSAADRVAAIMAARRMASVGYDALPQWDSWSA